MQYITSIGLEKIVKPTQADQKPAFKDQTTPEAKHKVPESSVVKQEVTKDASIHNPSIVETLVKEVIAPKPDTTEKTNDQLPALEDKDPSTNALNSTQEVTQ